MKQCKVCFEKLRSHNKSGFCTEHYYKDWRRKNERAANKRKYEKHKDKILIGMKKYAETHKEKISEYQKQWRRDNYDKKKAYDAEYYEENSLQYVLSAKARKRRLKQRTLKGLSEKQLKELYEFYKNCPEGYEVDHIVPLNGKNVSGLHVPWNLQYLTPKQNRAKSNKY